MQKLTNPQTYPSHFFPQYDFSQQSYEICYVMDTYCAWHI